MDPPKFSSSEVSEIAESAFQSACQLHSIASVGRSAAEIQSDLKAWWAQDSYDFEWNKYFE
jgi:hypothetical protein